MVQAFASEHDPPLAVCTQPVWGAQPSSEHGLSSSQPRTPLPVHCPAALQVSTGVHRLPSLQVVPTNVEPLCRHRPLAVSQLSCVQGLASVQSTALKATHDPPAHLSPVVHGLESLQVPELAEN